MRSFFVEYWSPASALDWRCGFEPHPSIDHAFEELRQLSLAGSIQAIGVRTMDHPRGFKLPPEDYRPFIDPPRPPDFEYIPAQEWNDLFLHSDGQLYLVITRLPVWSQVELPRLEVILAWWPIIEASKASGLAFLPTGAPGRPSKGMHLIREEFERRRQENECKLTLREEASHLEVWFCESYPGRPPVGRQTIENNIRRDYKRWAVERAE